jgi:hypothetical protein
VIKSPAHMSKQLNLLFPALFQTLSDDSEEVATADLEVLCDFVTVFAFAPRFRMCVYNLFYSCLQLYFPCTPQVLSRLSAQKEQFDRCLLELIALFNTDRQLLQKRGGLIVRKLCVYLGPERIFTSFAEMLPRNRVRNCKTELMHKFNQLHGSVFLHLETFHTKHNRMWTFVPLW